jgi:chorismate dehydratase
MTPIRLGYVKYLNTLPLVQGLAACRELELHAAVPSHLISMLERDEIDVGLVSLVDAARSDAELALLPVGMIGCDGPTLTVRLFSSVPLEQLHEIHADTDSHTSAALVQVVLREMYGVRPRLVAFDARERVALRSVTKDTEVGGPTSVARGDAGAEWPEAMLLIGDKVVTDSPPAVRYPHQLDLGEAWKKLTGLPFMYAVWMCKAERAGSAEIRHAAALLDRQRRHNATRMDWIVSANAADRAWPDDLARTYLGALLRYEVTAEAREAAERFVARAGEMGLCRAGAGLEWAGV